MNGNKKIFITEDHTILRAGLKALLTTNPSFEVVGEADNGRDAIRYVAETRPDLVLMDLSMPGLSGVEAIRKIRNRHPETKVLVLSMHSSEEYVLASLEAGANGYLLKDATHAELMIAAERILDGKTYLSPDIAEKVVTSYLTSKKHSAPASRWDTVTPREKQVLKLIAEGNSNKDMAEYLYISVKTIEKHRANLMRKLELHNVSALTSYAIDKGLVSL
jgi:DNA-binding NarL/FixJ family response regulator